jgi:N-acetylneuraminic acid mutarotase
VIDLFLDKNNRKIYIVGNFKFVNRVPLENIAVYDLNEKKWKHVGEGIPQVATAIAVDEENEIVYVGGVFSKVGKGDCEVQANNVAAYHVKENKWVALGEGLNRDCSSILFDKNTKKLYAGGSFTQSGSKILKYVAVYDIEDKAWQPLKGGSVNGSCRIVLKPNEDDLYLGGLFTHAGNDDLHVSYVARYNLKNDTWHSLGGGLQGYCNAISYDCTKNKLYVGGTFTSVGSIDASINANHIAEYDMENNSWNDMDGGLNNIVQSIFYDANNECVYVGGTFTHSFENNIQLNHIARYDLRESKWCCLENHFPNKTHDGTDNVGLNGNCKVMSVDNKSLFIAGSFQIAGNITANSIVRYSLNP